MDQLGKDYKQGFQEYKNLLFNILILVIGFLVFINVLGVLSQTYEFPAIMSSFWMWTIPAIIFLLIGMAFKQITNS
jgi:uncharacterized ion transporter superfamily protein YfcC